MSLALGVMALRGLGRVAHMRRSSWEASLPAASCSANLCGSPIPLGTRQSLAGHFFPLVHLAASRSPNEAGTCSHDNTKKIAKIVYENSWPQERKLKSSAPVVRSAKKHRGHQTAGGLL